MEARSGIGLFLFSLGGGIHGSSRKEFGRGFVVLRDKDSWGSWLCLLFGGSN